MKQKIVVIGSGLAGSLICNELVKGSSVTLLESGDKEKITYPVIDFTNKHFGAVKTCCLGEGGTTNLWDNGLIPINPDDVLSESFGRVLKQAKPFEDSAAENLFFGEKRYSAEYDSVLTEMTGLARSQGVFPDGVDCLLYPKKHKRLRVSNEVNAIYNVDNIDFESENRRLKTIHYSVDGKRFSIDPDALIICAGALNTPLLVKKVLTAAGVPFNQAGIGLVDHPMGFVGKIKVKKEFQAQIQQMVFSDKGDYIYRTAVRLKSECGQYTGCAFFRPALTMHNSLSIYKYKSLLGANKGMARFKNAFSWKLLHPDILAEIYSHLFGMQVKSGIFNILLLFEQKRGSSRVSYEGPDMKVDWRITEEELNIYNGILRKLNEMLRPISTEMVIEMPLTEEWLWSAAHHSGTIPLGPMPEGIVDTDLKLHACDNVYVCDGSIIQEHSYANTGLTIGQLGMHLSKRMLKKEIA